MSQNFEELTDTLKGLAENLRGLQELGVAEYTPVVEQIIASRSRDVRHIERTLDGILDFACHPDGLALFKSLCRYYYTIDPNATGDYVRFYREVWEEDAVEEEGGA